MIAMTEKELITILNNAKKSKLSTEANLELERLEGKEDNYIIVRGPYIIVRGPYIIAEGLNEKNANLLFDFLKEECNE